MAVVVHSQTHSVITNNRLTNNNRPRHKISVVSVYPEVAAAAVAMVVVSKQILRKTKARSLLVVKVVSMFKPVNLFRTGTSVLVRMVLMLHTKAALVESDLEVVANPVEVDCF